VFVDGRSRREAAKVFGLSQDTVARIYGFSLPSRTARGTAWEAETRAAIVGHSRQPARGPPRRAELRISIGVELL